MCVTDRHDMTLAVKVALNPDTANKPNFPRAKKKRNKECTIITITLVLKMDLQKIDPAASHFQVGQPKHSAEKAVKAIEIAMLWSVLYSTKRHESQQAAYLLEKMQLRMPDHYESSYTRHHIYNKDGLG